MYFPTTMITIADIIKYLNIKCCTNEDFTIIYTDNTITRKNWLHTVTLCCSHSILPQKSLSLKKETTSKKLTIENICLFKLKVYFDK